MSGIFGVVSRKECIDELFYGVDYHSHLGTKNGGMALMRDGIFYRDIHGISSNTFRAQFENFRERVKKERCNAKKGIGAISDDEPQPLIIDSRIGRYSLVHVGKISNLDELAESVKKQENIHFSDTSDGRINPTELLASLINRGRDYAEGIEIMQNSIEGSSSLMILAEEGIYLVRDRFGRTPLLVGKGEEGFAATLETTAFSNLGFETERGLGPGEIGLLTERGYTQLKKPEDKLQICSFLWIYYGYPSSSYEGINVEVVRENSGRALGKSDEEENLDADYVSGIPDSGTGHAHGYANERRMPYKRPYVKYTPAWQRSFMPREQEDRDLVARMKLILIPELIQGKKILFCEDSIVRGTQLRDTIKRVYRHKPEEVHMRPACPPIAYACKFLNFSRSSSERILAVRKAVEIIEGKTLEGREIAPYIEEGSERYGRMVEKIRKDFGLTSLKYQKMEDMVGAIGLPKEKLCTYCWDGCDGCGK